MQLPTWFLQIQAESYIAKDAFRMILFKTNMKAYITIIFPRNQNCIAFLMLCMQLYYIYYLLVLEILLNLNLNTDSFKKLL